MYSVVKDCFFITDIHVKLKKHIFICSKRNALNIEILIGFIAATSLLAITPGPDNIYVLMQSIVNGRKYGIATVLGLMSGCIIHTTIVAFGASTILKENPTLFFIIKLFGALYLVYLAYKVFKSSGAIELGNDAIPKKSVFELFKQGFIMNVLNPKVTLFFLALFPGFLFSDELSKWTKLLDG